MSGMFFTDPTLAFRIVEWANVHGLNVLEPSAGDGSIVRELLKVANRVTAVEIDTKLANTVRKVEHKPLRSGRPRLTVLNEDYLAVSFEKQFDVVVANPPYENGCDVSHVARMLEHAPRVVVLVRTNFCFLRSAHTHVFSKATLDRRVGFIARGARFYGPDDKGSTPRHDYEILEFRRESISIKHGASMVRTEWWSRESISTKHGASMVRTAWWNREA